MPPVSQQTGTNEDRKWLAERMLRGERAIGAVDTTSAVHLAPDVDHDR
jgi:hypothetical protein